MMSFADKLYEAGGRVYEVGGTIRDRLLGREHKDRDLVVTGVPIDRLTAILRRFGDVFTVGKSFGVVKFYPREEKELSFDIALPRKEISTGVGHRDFEVDFDPSLPIEVDLSRRDFTINAMAKEISSDRLIDPFHGEADLKAKILRMVSEKAFEEDPLRLMRGVQFAARFHLEIEAATFEAMRKAAPLIKSVSPERISEELKKLLTAEKPSAGFVWMQKIGLLGEVFPEVAENVGVEQGNKFHKDDVFLHTMRVLDASRKDPAIPTAGDLELMLAALFHDVGKARTKRFDKEKNRLTFYGHQLLSKRMARRRMAELRMTTMGIEPENVAHLVEHHMFQTKAYFSDRAIRRFINKIGPEHILKLVDLRLADNRGGKYPEGIKGVLRLRKKIAEEMEKKTPFGVRDLAIKGGDILALGVPEGPEVGKILKDLVEVVLDDPDKNTKESLIEIVKEKIEKGKK
jgi:putative nucleotidyltransferase with HDIG domain